jgi:hypothetical protein
MSSRASAVNLNWGNVALTSGRATERQEAPADAGQGSPRRESQAADSTRTSRHLDEGSCDVETVNATVEAYNEAAFRYFLQVEEKRFLRSNRKFLLLLLDLTGDSGTIEDFDPVLSKKVFAALWPCVRETDFVGWFRQGRVIGVACTLLDGTQGATASSVVAERFQKAMRDALPEPIGNRVNVRSYFLPSNSAERS